MKRQANQIKSVGKSMSSFGSSLTKNVTAPILATLGATGKMADTFEKDMGQVNTLLDNKEHLQKYKDTAIQVSNDTGIALGTVSINCCVAGLYTSMIPLSDASRFFPSIIIFITFHLFNYYQTAMSKTGKSKSYQWFPAMAKTRNHSYSIESGAPKR